MSAFAHHFDTGQLYNSSLWIWWRRCIESTLYICSFTQRQICGKSIAKNHETTLWVPIQSPEPSSAKYAKYLSWSLSLFNPYIHLDIHLNSDGSLRLFTRSLRPRQMAAISEMTFSRAIFLNKNLLILDKISLKRLPYVLIDIVTALVQIIARHQTGDKPLSEAMVVCFTDAYMRHSTPRS